MAAMGIHTAKSGADWREKSVWPTSERLLRILSYPQCISGAPVVSSILKTWNKARKYLRLDQMRNLPGNLSVVKYCELAMKQNWLSTAEAQEVRKVLRKEKLQTLRERHMSALARPKCSRSDTDVERTMERGRGLKCGPSSTSTIDNLEWIWRPKTKEYTGWELNTSVWKRVFQNLKEGYQSLNHKWRRSDSQRRWGKRLTKIWQSKIPNRDKVWCWKVLNQGLATEERTAKWRQDSGFCDRCNQEVESVNHMFIECPHAAYKWQEWQTNCQGEEWRIQTDGDLIDMLDKICKGHRAQKISLFAKTTWHIWLERNSYTYNNKTLRIPFRVTLRMARDLLLAAATFAKPGSKSEELLKTSIDEIVRCIPANPQDNETNELGETESEENRVTSRILTSDQQEESEIRTNIEHRRSYSSNHPDEAAKSSLSRNEITQMTSYEPHLERSEANESTNLVRSTEDPAMARGRVPSDDPSHEEAH
ncbi:hypothetical protein R1sor_000385 [Riccia sorocarpa]|uniref:Reverse transcriptase zinc-binding domain-containing protein n=1 Tax=Riccia sorocarpa TaxID=122646 RepID=A0ABD3GT76_9MARC